MLKKLISRNFASMYLKKQTFEILGLALAFEEKFVKSMVSTPPVINYHVCVRQNFCRIGSFSNAEMRTIIDLTKNYMIKWKILFIYIFDLILIFFTPKKFVKAIFSLNSRFHELFFHWEQISRFSTHFATKCYNMKIPWNLIFTKEPLSLICDLTKKVSCF